MPVPGRKVGDFVIDRRLCLFNGIYCINTYCIKIPKVELNLTLGIAVYCGMSLVLRNGVRRSIFGAKAAEAQERHLQ